MRRKLASIFGLVICLSFMTFAVRGQDGYEIVAVSGSTPTVDGQIDVDEWNDASVQLLDDDTTFYLKQDGENLYVGFNVSDSTYRPEDGIAIYMDVENDKSTSLQTGDIGFVAYRDGNMVEGNVTAGSWTFTTVSGWTAQVHSASNLYQVEFNITYAKIDVVAGIEKTIGAAFQRSNNGMSFSAWPSSGFIKTSPATWGNITSTGYNWVPEFSSFLILPLFMITTLLAVIVYRRRHFTKLKERINSE
jgi:hypothetical protein